MNNDVFYDADAKELAKFVFDENYDGSIDTILEYTKNEEGKIVEFLLDYDGDGVGDCKVFLEYDGLGRISRKAIDKNLSGKINAIEIYEYDAVGNRTVRYDDNADGKIDYMTYINEKGKEEVVDLRNKREKIVDTLKNIFPDKMVKFFEK